jgi:predicted ABC-type ATPase
MSQFDKDDFRRLVNEYKELATLGPSPSATAKKREMIDKLEKNKSFRDIFKINTIGDPRTNHERPPSQGPKLIIMVGGPGSGKTTIRSKCLEKLTQNNAIVLNPDYIFTELFDNDHSYRSTLNELFRIFYQQYLGNQETHIGSCKNIVLDRTGAYTEATEYIVKSLKAFSEHNCAYEVILCVADVDVDVAYKRTIARSSEDGEEPGRVVPKDIVYRTHEAVDSAMVKYTENSPIQLFSSLENARDNMEKQVSKQTGFTQQNTKTAYIDNGNLIIHTNDYGYITIPNGNWSFDGAIDSKPVTGEFGTPISVKDISRPITSTSTVTVTMGNGDILMFQNSYRLYDKIYIYNNDGKTPDLIYSAEYGNVEVNKMTYSDPSNRYNILSQAVVTMPKGGRFKTRKNKRRVKRRKTKKSNRRKTKKSKRRKTKRKPQK